MRGIRWSVLISKVWWSYSNVVLSPDPTREEGSMENLAWKCLECWNAAISVDEGTNRTSAYQCSSSINDKKQIYDRT